ncbi:hypothetical protein GLOIN_2v1598067, partial [Rhizophagus irregularis DAOM 181602=DAOM 197198]
MQCEQNILTFTLWAYVFLLFIGNFIKRFIFSKKKCSTWRFSKLFIYLLLLL